MNPSLSRLLILPDYSFKISGASHRFAIQREAIRFQTINHCLTRGIGDAGQIHGGVQVQAFPVPDVANSPDPF